MKEIMRKIKLNSTLSKQIVFVAIAFVIMVALSYIFMSTIVRGSLLRNVDGMLDVSQAHISSQLREFEVTMEYFTDDMNEMVLNGDSAEMLRKRMEDISEVASLDGSETSGIRAVYGYFETLPGGPRFISGEDQPEIEGTEPTESDWYQSAVKSAGDTVETNPYINDENETLYTYAKCLTDERGRRLAVVCMDIKIDAIGQDVVDTTLKQGGYGMLLSGDMEVLFHPNLDFVGLNVSDPDIPVHVFANDLSKDKEVFEEPLTSYKGESSVAFFRKLSNDWYLGLVVPKSQYYRSINTMAFVLVGLGLVLAIILIGILIRIDSARTKSEDESREKSMFLANTSHEIRTPINAIVGMSAIGKTAGTAERKDYCFSKIDNASKYLLGVINDILDMSKIEAGKIELFDTDFNFEKMLKQVVNVVTFRADEKHQKLVVNIDKAIPESLHGDDQRFAQVITNLLNNAVKFTPDEGTVSLKTSLLCEADGLYTVKVEVSDTGIGMSREQQEKLFRPFQQAESSTTRKYGGTGLGLAISKNIVEMMDGKIGVESELGKGTTIAFTVKMKQGSESGLDLSYQSVNWKNVRILTVDDDPDILQYFKEVIAGFGAVCEVAASAKEALKLIEERGPYNIYFVDLRMPDVDGIRLTEEIRAQEKTDGNSVVIMISSAELSAIEADAKKVGVNRFLLKPLFPSAIADVISECIGNVREKPEDDQPNIDGIFSGRNILFAEDIDINREIVITLLEPTGLSIDCAENGIEAVNMLCKEPEKYEMIFMDIQMPEMDGYEATRQIRALNIPNAKTIPIVAMTANVFKEDIENCLAAGMDGHLGKPLDMDEMIFVLKKHLLS